METIDKILQKLGTSKKEIDLICEMDKCCNGCGGKGGINFEKVLSGLPYFQEDKGKKLLEDLHYLCNWHDIQFFQGGGVLDFIKANYLFAWGVYKLVNWTKFLNRITLFLFIFVALNLFGGKYFKWK